MAVKSNFASGEVLTASDVNTYLTNGGLVYITEVTVGSGVASVTVSNCFSSTYDSYVIVDSGGSMSSDTAYGMTLGSATTGYYYFLTYGSYAGTTVSGDNGNNTTKWAHAGGGGARSGHIVVLNPYLAMATDIQAKVRYGTVYGTEIGHRGDNVSYTSFTLTPASGTMSNGKIRVYGYRQA